MGNVSVTQERSEAPPQPQQYFWKPPRIDLTRFPPYSFPHETKAGEPIDTSELDPRYDTEFTPPPGTPELSGPRPKANMIGVIADEPEWLDDIKHKPAIPSSYFVQTDYMNDELLKREIDHNGLRMPPNARHIRKLPMHVQHRIVEDYDNTINGLGDDGFFRNDMEKFLAKNKMIPSFFMVPDDELRRGRDFQGVLYERLMEKHVDDPELKAIYHKPKWGTILRTLKYIILPGWMIFWVCTSKHIHRMEDSCFKFINDFTVKWLSTKQQDFIDWYSTEGEGPDYVKLVVPPTERVMSGGVVRGDARIWNKKQRDDFVGPVGSVNTNSGEFFGLPNSDPQPPRQAPKPAEQGVDWLSPPRFSNGGWSAPGVGNNNENDNESFGFGQNGRSSF